MEQQPPDDDGEFAMKAHLTVAEAYAGRPVLRIIDGSKESRPAEPARYEPSQWGGFIAVDLHRDELMTRETVRRVTALVATAIGRQAYEAASRCEGTVVTTVFDVPDNGPDSRKLLSEATAQVAGELLPATVVRSEIGFCDAEGVQLTSSAGVATVRFVPTLVRPH